ncbi:zinc metalloproteinase nas-8-like [Photinus pyralis]|uniref:zinc metalloproteinase nas-8-like n=1 Tax=Photinus pyralis TaxID=7054 RepID=UPI0012675554|nr:zinc metalloproteinase nas-8-like [Photinus pyralis]
MEPKVVPITVILISSNQYKKLPKAVSNLLNLLAGTGSNLRENSEKLEGDMVFLRKRNGVVRKVFRWPNGQICYTISPSYNQSQADIIRSTIASGFSGTCAQWKECHTCCNGDYINITYSNDHGCESAVGRWGGQQILNFQSSCFDRGTMLHEMLHAVGFRHQHNSPDRDDYITINRENLKDGSTTVLKKYTSSEVTNFGLPYDYCSVSHYSMFASSKNGKPTIVPKFPTTCELGTATDLSPIDKKKINLMYPCGL